MASNCHVKSLVLKVGRSGGRTTHELLLDHIARSIAWYDRPSAASGQVMGTRQLPYEGHMAARTRLEQVRIVILQRRVRETQF